jgi:hypothetical protein
VNLFLMMMSITWLLMELLYLLVLEYFIFYSSFVIVYIYLGVVIVKAMNGDKVPSPNCFSIAFFQACGIFFERGHHEGLS